MIGPRTHGRRETEKCVSINCRAATTLRIGGARTGAQVFAFPGAAAASGSAPSSCSALSAIVDPSVLIGGAEILTGGGTSQQQSSPASRDSAGARDTGASDQMGQFVSAVLGSTEAQWQKIFAQYGKTYEPPTLVMFSGATRSACGFAQSAMGPFYCPN